MPYARACPIWDVKPPLSLVCTCGSQLAFTGSSITGTKDRPKNFSDTHSGKIPTRTDTDEHALTSGLGGLRSNLLPLVSGKLSAKAPKASRFFI